MPASSCQYGKEPGESVWFLWVGPRNGLYIISLHESYGYTQLRGGLLTVVKLYAQVEEDVGLVGTELVSATGIHPQLP